MTGDDDFDRVFGARRLAPATFSERVKPSAPPPALVSTDARETTVGSTDYRPYGFLPQSVGETCDVRRWMPSTGLAEGLEFQYRFLMQVSYVQDEELRLFLPDLIVVIEGSGLTDLRRKLARRQVSFIQQFSSQVWPMPPRDEPIIDKIEVVRPEMMRGAG